MHAPSETELIEWKGWTLRVRPSAARPPRLLLLIHGWTGDEDSMWIFARDLPGDYWVIAPRAPHATRPSGYSWRVGPPQGKDYPDLEDLRSSAKALITLAAEYCAAHDMADRTFDVMGFSQGAVMAITLALLFPNRIGKLAVLAGFVPKGAESLVQERALLGVRVFVAHGSMDETVPIESAWRSVHLLEDAGASVTVCEDEVGHKVSAACRKALQAFLLS